MLSWSVDLLGFFGSEGRLPVAFARQMHGSDYAWSHLYALQSPTALWTSHGVALVILAYSRSGCSLAGLRFWPS